MADKVGVASVGLGRWGANLALAAKSTGDFELVSCYARTAETREKFAAEHGCRTAADIDELLADPEVSAIIVATSHQSHRSLIEAAARAGKHVFVEKPFTVSVDDGRAAVDAARKAAIVLQVGHQRRRLVAHREIRAMIEGGEIGEIQLLEANHSLPSGFRMPETAWRWNPDESPLGSMTSLGIHQIDTFTYLAGPIAAVSTSTRPGRDGVSIDEATGLLFEFESGAVGTLLTSFFTPWNIRLAVHGTEGAAFSDADGELLEYQARGERERVHRPVGQVDPLGDQLAEFARAVRGEAIPEVGGEEGLEVIAVLEAAVESSRTGRRVDVADHRR